MRRRLTDYEVTRDADGLSLMIRLPLGSIESANAPTCIELGPETVNDIRAAIEFERAEDAAEQRYAVGCEQAAVAAFEDAVGQLS